MIQTITLSPGVTLRCFRDTRFHQGCLSFQLLRPMCRAEASVNALIPALLLRGTQKDPDLRAITMKLDGLYGASVGTLVRRIGDHQTTGLYCSFIEDRFALPGEQVLAPLADFLGQLLLEPALENGTFRAGYVESEKRNLIATIESERNDKRHYAMAQLLRAMCQADPYGIPRLGTAEDVAAITARSAWDHYQAILRESPVEIFYVGSFPAEEVAKLIMPIVDKIDRNYRSLSPQTPFRDAGGADITEALEVSQGQLCLGYTTPITNRDPEFAAMQVMNTIFGSGQTAKLFMNVREKLSLCYAIHSGYYGSKGIITVQAGIDFHRENQVRGEIARQLDGIRAGDFTEEELNSAKEAILSSLRGTHDSPGSIEGYYSTAALSGLGRTPSQYMAEVTAVTAEAVIAAAKTLTLHTTYFLKGVAE